MEEMKWDGVLLELLRMLREVNASMSAGTEHSSDTHVVGSGHH
jgi:hypothetical protein